MLEELLRAQGSETDDDALTTRELAERLGRSKNYVLPRLHALMREGKLERVCKHVVGIDGRRMSIVAWRLVERESRS